MWAIISIIVINHIEGVWQRPNPESISGDIRLFVITAILLALIASVHIWLGYNPFSKG